MPTPKTRTHVYSVRVQNQHSGLWSETEKIKQKIASKIEGRCFFGLLPSVDYMYTDDHEMRIQAAEAANALQKHTKASVQIVYQQEGVDQFGDHLCYYDCAEVWRNGKWL